MTVLTRPCIEAQDVREGDRLLVFEPWGYHTKVPAIPLVRRVTRQDTYVVIRVERYRYPLAFALTDPITVERTSTDLKETNMDTLTIDPATLYVVETYEGDIRIGTVEVQEDGALKVKSGYLGRPIVIEREDVSLIVPATEHPDVEKI